MEQINANVKGQLDPEQWLALSQACDLLTMTFRYPDDFILGWTVSSGEWKDAVKEVAESLGFQLPEGFEETDFAVDAEGNPTADDDAFLEVLTAEAERLFKGQKPLVPMKEYAWDHADDSGTKYFMAQCGYFGPEGGDGANDTIDQEIELLGVLAIVAGGANQPAQETPDPERLPGGSGEAAYHRWFDQHIARWVSDFAKAVEKETTLPFYRAAAQVLQKFVA